MIQFLVFCDVHTFSCTDVKLYPPQQQRPSDQRLIAVLNAYYPYTVHSEGCKAVRKITELVPYITAIGTH